MMCRVSQVTGGPELLYLLENLEFFFFDVGPARAQVKLETPKFLVPKAVKDFEVKFKQFIAWEF